MVTLPTPASVMVCPAVAVWPSTVKSLMRTSPVTLSTLPSTLPEATAPSLIVTLSSPSVNAEFTLMFRLEVSVAVTTPPCTSSTV